MLINGSMNCNYEKYSEFSDKSQTQWLSGIYEFKFVTFCPKLLHQCTKI